MVLSCVFSTAAMMVAALVPLVAGSAVSRSLLEKLPVVMGEHGVAEAIIGEYTRVDLNHTYIEPVVVVGSVGMFSLANSRPISAYVSEAGPDYFLVRTEDGSGGDLHFVEDVPYLVMEAGDYTFEDGTRITAGFSHTRASRAEPSPGKEYTMVDIMGFNAAPNVIAGFMNETDATVAAWSTVRVGDRGEAGGRLRVTPDEFGVRGQSAEFRNSHQRSQPSLIGFVAMEPRSGMESLNAKRIEAGKYEKMPSGKAAFTSTTFSSDFQEAPTFLAVAGDVGRDGINVRHRTFQNGQYEVAVQEPDSSGHAREDLYHYFAIDGTGQGNMLMGYTWPEASEAPSLAPSLGPSSVPTMPPSAKPSLAPTAAPFTPPSPGPTLAPSAAPSGAPFCSAGILDSSGAVCCAAGCGTCGGCGCAKRGDVLHKGASYCCPTAITRSEISCELSSDVGCLIPIPTSAPTPFASRSPTTQDSANAGPTNPSAPAGSTPKAAEKEASATTPGGPASPSSGASSGTEGDGSAADEDADCED